MKITNELNNKISKSVNQKYELTLLKIRNDIKEIKEKKSQEYVSVAKDVCLKYPEMESILKYCYGYSADIDKNVKDIFMSKICLVDEDVKSLVRQEKEILDKIKVEIENAKIQISYGKTFEDIKNVFAEYELDF